MSRIEEGTLLVKKGKAKKQENNKRYPNAFGEEKKENKFYIVKRMLGNKVADFMLLDEKGRPTLGNQKDYRLATEEEQNEYKLKKAFGVDN